MTTHEQHTYTESTEGVENPREGAESAPPAGEQSSGEATDRQAQPDWSEGQMRSAEQTQSVREPTESTTERSLFPDDELAGLRARWDNVQAGFVDDPRDCVHKADGLVSDVVDQLTAGFSDARARLEEQWARGEEASTEDLRVALKQYREFFQRLLAV